MHLLLVCTANVCRSVMAEASLRHHLPSDVTITSAGLLADGSPSDPAAVAAIGELGRTTSARPSQRVDRHLALRADLVLGMAMHHVRDVVVLDRTLFPRSFTLAELVDRAERLGARKRNEEVSTWLERMHHGRQAPDLMRSGSLLDISDPTGSEPSAYGATARLIDDLCARLAAALNLSAGGAALVVVLDGASRHVEGLLATTQADRAVHLEASWTDVAARARRAIADGDAQLVVCITDEPQGVAIEVNRDPAARAAVVANAGMAARVRRRLDANVLCVPGGIDQATLQEVFEVVAQSTAQGAARR